MSNRLPQIRRARGYHLYDHRGRRFLDMYLNEGRALLGHRPERISSELKALISRGLYAEYPTVYSARAERAVARAIALWTGESGEASGYVGRIFRNADRAIDAVGSAFGYSGTRPVPRDPAIVGASAAPAPVILWRPFCPRPELTVRRPAVIPILPFPGAWTPSVVLFPAESTHEPPLPATDDVAAPLLAALIRSIHDVERLGGWEQAGGDVRELPAIWRRVGPYLTATCSESQYQVLFGRFLDRGIVVNPRYPGPTILPINWSEGERSLFERLSRELTREFFGNES